MQALSRWLQPFFQQHTQIGTAIKGQTCFRTICGGQEPSCRTASLCGLAGRYDNPIPTLFLAPIDCLKIPALATKAGGIASWAP